jgi:hypothetical protein
MFIVIVFRNLLCYCDDDDDDDEEEEQEEDNNNNNTMGEEISNIIFFTKFIPFSK